MKKIGIWVDCESCGYVDYLELSYLQANDLEEEYLCLRCGNVLKIEYAKI